MVEGQARGSRHRRIAGERGAGWILVCAAMLLWTNAASAEPCAPWPGEPRPLPRVDAEDEMLRRWATLRVRELSLLAEAREEEAPLRAHRLWRRVLCLDPASDAAVAGLARTPPVVVHRPVLTTRGADAATRDAWAGLADPLRVRAPAPPAPPPPQEPAFDALAEALAASVREARFADALAEVEATRAAATTPAQRARVDVLAATAALALGRGDEADTHLGRALEADPDLALDPMTTPPKVRRALDRVRAARQP